MKVELLNPEMCKDFFKRWGETSCVCYNTLRKYAERVGKSCFLSGHYSGSRDQFFKFEITCSRACIDQLARHEVGVVKNVMSGRYVDFSDFEYYTPELVAEDDDLNCLYREAMMASKIYYNMIVKNLNDKDIKGEQAFEIARGIAPMNHNTKAIISFNLEALINLSHKRLCSCAQKEIREVVKEMVKLVTKEIPELSTHLVPICGHLKYCPENKNRSCGMFKTLDQ